MSEINILSPHVADLIAAGEVVERPASVIKELIENSFDASARNVTVELRGGGMTYIRVTDDGCGMLPEDAGLCFMRHATSKLHDERGLEAIGTMGFRGEALAAIAAVSRIELLTRRKGANEGTRVALDAGDIVEMSPHGTPEGTTLIVRDLFYNTPARLKFMKSDRAEASACSAVALRCALGRPEISVRLIRDGEEEFFSPGDSKLSSCAYSLLGRDISKELLECSSEGDGLSVSGFVGSPKAGHGNRAKQFFFVNGRSIKSQLLQAAVEQAYKNTLLTGRYPSCIIYLTLSPGSVDVNVHPAKTEVKFRNEKRVFDAIHYAALSSLEGETRTAEITLSSSTKAAVSPNRDFYKTIGADEYREKYSVSHGTGTSVPYRQPHPSVPARDNGRGTIVWNRTTSSSRDTTAVRESETPYRVEKAASYHTETPLPAAADPEVEGPAKADMEVLGGAPGDFRLVGEAMKTYIIVEKGSELLLIDKHAAHERMIFDRLKNQDRAVMSQSLMIPVTVKLSGGELDLLEKSGEALEGLGFEIEPYGTDSVIVRCAPADTDVSDVASLVEEICGELKKGSSPSKDSALDALLHTVACKAAVKAGWNTEPEELLEIANAVVSGDVKYCPHGRPVAVALTKKQLDKEFSRIV
ncbi:MAG: DNA mismatch repair endonuclease MutL [Oscillospiraceae bacterium]|nr:DNA mismatch repair endonuclease MutL [Oscillospiraceae bacterium]